MKPSTHRLPGSLSLLTLACLLATCFTATAHAQVQIYALFGTGTGVWQGPATGYMDNPPPNTGAVLLQSVAFSADNPVTFGGTGGGGAGTGKAVFNPMQLTKFIDKLSPQIFAFLTTGNHLDDLTLFFRKDIGGTTVTFLKMEFKLVFFSSTAVAASNGDSDLQENISAQYGAQRITFFPTTAGGGIGTPVVQQWSQVLNQPVYAVE